MKMYNADDKIFFKTVTTGPDYEQLRLTDEQTKAWGCLYQTWDQTELKSEKHFSEEQQQQ